MQALKQGALTKEAAQSWTSEVFRVVEKLKTFPARYKVQALDGEEIIGTFLQGELQLAEPGASEHRQVVSARRVSSRPQRYRVQWKNWPKGSVVDPATLEAAKRPQ